MTVIWMEEDGRPAGRDNVSHRHRGIIAIPDLSHTLVLVNDGIEL